ncbi:MAG: hypothetical protein AAGA60_23055 [Cyanobacteria bacterium P01_E01_bin.42]
MKHQFFCVLGSIAMVTLGWTSSPALAGDLNAQLNEAVCNGNWKGAIDIIDGAIAQYPQYSQRLQSYRDRLEELHGANVFVSNRETNCGSTASSPSPTATQPTTTPSTPPPSRRSRPSFPSAPSAPSAPFVPSPSISSPSAPSAPSTPPRPSI